MAHGEGDIVRASGPESAAAVVLGVLLGFLAVGWPFSAGALLNLDLVAIGTLDVPDSLLGGGSGIPRRAPLQGLLALLSPPFSAASVTRCWMIAIIASAFVGTARYLRRQDVGVDAGGTTGTPWPVAAGAATVYALSPFLLTRLAVGHIGFAMAVGLLPWAVGVLLDPWKSPRLTLWYLGLFALGGYFGFIVAGPTVLIGLLLGGRGLSARAAALGVASQAPWLLPALIRIGSTTDAGGSAQFPTDLDGAADLVRLVLGFGFWRATNQLGEQGVWSLGFALILVLLALVGARWGSRRDGVGLGVLAAVGLVVGVASRLPGLDDFFDQLTSLAPFAPIREGHRLVVFVVFAVVVFASRGVAHLLTYRPPRVHLIAGVALALAAFVIMGEDLGNLGGATTAHRTPEAWAQVADTVEADPGPTLALPWDQYFDVAIADGTRAHTPLPFLIDADVIHRHDLDLDSNRTMTSSGDGERSEQATTLVRGLRLGDDVAPLIHELNLRWIVALPDIGTVEIERLRELKLPVVVDDPSILLVSVPRSATPSTTEPDDALGAGLFANRWVWLILVVDTTWLVFWMAGRFGFRISRGLNTVQL